MLNLIPIGIVIICGVVVLINPERGPWLAHERQQHQGFPLPPAVLAFAKRRDRLGAICFIGGGLLVLVRVLTA